MSASLLFWAWAVKAMPAQAVEVGGYKQFFLDQGFLGRAFKLDVEDIKLSILFDADTIPKPGVLHVITQPISATSSILGYPRFGQDVRIDWTTNVAEVPETVVVKLSDPACGATAWRQCAIEETYQGKTRLIRPERSSPGSSEVKIRMGSTLRLVEVEAYMAEGSASWYAYKKCPCAASPDFPKGTLVKVTKLSDLTKSIVVKINDFGPERDIFPDRAIDLDKVAFAALAPVGAGVIRVRVEPLAPNDPAALAYVNQIIPIKTVAVVSSPVPKPPEWSL